ncbi:MAG: hydrogenase formation protein HypD [Deltaproteobacteria bacterium]|nr:hydrogenase formation protein HypD [Deltaproteobacteria bacterium]
MTPSSPTLATADVSTRALADEIIALAQGGPERRLMEVCGTHTVSFFRSGVKGLLPPEVRLVSGPGCPVCVTASGYLDAAVRLAERGLTICTYGDMVRVPGTTASLGEIRAQGGKVQVVYGARDALKYAIEHPDEEVIFLAVGFETTAPATALTVLEAQREGATNFSVLTAHKLAVPAMMALLSAGEVPIDGFICPGHVSVIIGSEAYRPIIETYAKPCVVAGFEPPSMLTALRRLVALCNAGEADLDNAYANVVRPHGNPTALAVLDRVFEPSNAIWRSLGTIPESGLVLRDAFATFDAEKRHDVQGLGDDEHPSGCLCGEVIQGKVDPTECALFGRRCTPARPVGPCMVSSEGTCAAWYKYGPGR